MKIAIVVHGRFYGFDLARELSRHHDVTVFTNYPKWAAKRFGLSPRQLRSFWAHGVASRMARWLQNSLSLPFPEAAEHRAFGYWAASQIRKERWDVVNSFSGVSEEVMRQLGKGHTVRMMVRGSAHIRGQARLLEEEERRTGLKLERPSQWIIAREEREYSLADRIVVLSRFAWDSFVREGVEPDRLTLLPLGTDFKGFRASQRTVDARCDRLLSGAPLRLLFVGALSFRKGVLDVASIARGLDMERFRIRLAGPISKEARGFVRALPAFVELIPKQPQHALPKTYAWGDVFLFPTIEDGFAVVLAQAAAAALPILTTMNCCGPDLIHEGCTGWVFPIRSASAFIERLYWCDTHRVELAQMVRNIHQHFQPRTWTDVAADFASSCTESMTPNGHKQAT